MPTQVSVDAQGRLVPASGERVYEVTDRGYFTLTQPELSLARLADWATDDLSHKDALARLNSSLESLDADSTLRSLLNGVHIPFILPRLDQDFSEELRGDLFPRLRRSYEHTYPGHEFREFATVPPSELLFISEDSRWANLLKAREIASVCGWYFPEALAGFAVPDHEKAVQQLPENFVLSGPSETTAALATFPEFMQNSEGKYGRLLALSPVQSAVESEQHLFWFFESYGLDLDFNRRSMIGPVSEYYSGGITLIA